MTNGLDIGIITFGRLAVGTLAVTLLDDDGHRQDTSFSCRVNSYRFSNDRQWRGMC